MNTEPVIAALTQQVACYKRLAKLAEVQHGHVQHGQTEQLLQVLQSRQAVLDQVAELEGAIGPAKRNWGPFLATLDARGRARAESLLADTRRLLEAITAADRNDALVLQQRKLNLGQQIRQATAARQVNRKYGLAAYGAPARQLDTHR